MTHATKNNHDGGNRRQRLRSYVIIAVLAAVAAAVGSILLFVQVQGNDETSFLRNDNSQLHHNRQLTSKASRSLSQFTDPKSVTLRTDSPDELLEDEEALQLHQNRNNCQIVYIMGVEGATHRGFMPILENLAKHQLDPTTNQPYVVDVDPMALKAGLFGWFKGRTKRWNIQGPLDIDNDSFVRAVVQHSCPNDGKKHVLIEWQSFPSGQEDDKRSYRVHRQHEWLTMTPTQIADTPEAMQQPANMTAFLRAYSPYVDVKFIVLHRPFLETIASHAIWDGGPEGHSNIIRGFMLILRRFLDAHPFDSIGDRLWSLVCVERIMARNYETAEQVQLARAHVLASMAKFLKWPMGECEHCFNLWRESRKDPEVILGEKNMEIMREHMMFLEGVWPPPGEEGVEEQQCGI